MANEMTLSIIKPNAVAKNVVGQILERFESAGLTIVACRMQRLSREKAEGFYAEHRERPFFNDLVAFMTSGHELPFPAFFATTHEGFTDESTP